jgi:hypothetical protein
MGQPPIGDKLFIGTWGFVVISLLVIGYTLHRRYRQGWRGEEAAAAQFDTVLAEPAEEVVSNSVSNRR